MGIASALEKAKSSSALGDKKLAIVPFVSQNKKKRKLQEKGSDPSVDDLGFLKMFAGPKQLGKAARQAASPALAKRKKGLGKGFWKIPRTCTAAWAMVAKHCLKRKGLLLL